MTACEAANQHVSKEEQNRQFNSLSWELERLAKSDKFTISPQLRVRCLREAMQHLCGQYDIRVRAAMQDYRDILMSCTPPVDPDAQ